MLKKLQLTIALIAGLVLAGNALAQTKVATLSPQAAMLNTKFAKSKLDALQTSSEFSKLKSNIESISAEITKMQETAKKDGMTWSDEQKTEHQRKLQFKAADAQTAQKKLQAMQGQAMQEIQRELMPKMREAVKAVVEKEKIDLVLDGSVILYAQDNVNITQKVIDRLNAAK